MADTTTFKNGDRVRFKPGPRSTSEVEATVTGEIGTPGAFGNFLVTKDDAGKERKMRPGACTLVASA